MDARTLGVHRNRIRKTVVAWLDANPDAPVGRVTWLVSLDGQQITDIAVPAECANWLREDGYTVTVQYSAATLSRVERFRAAESALVALDVYTAPIPALEAARDEHAIAAVELANAVLSDLGR